MKRAVPSAEFRAALANFPKGIAVPGDSHEVVRAKFKPAHGHDPGPDIAVEPASYGGVGGVWVSLKTKRHRDDEPVLLFLHGGALVSCTAAEYTFYAAWFVRATGARAFVVDYRLAPEHRFPAALDDCVASHQGLVASGIAPERIALLGDSCGGGFVVTTLVKLRDLGAPLPACAVSLGGWLDAEVSGDSATNPVAEDVFVNAEWMRERWRDYLGPHGDARHPHVSPIHADLRGLPPLLLQYGQIDSVRDDGVRLAARAGRDGVAVTLEIWPGMIHGFVGLHGFCPEAAWAVKHAAEFVARHAR
ncbi:MAG: alpha/beta hydrolase [Deltaproteobacteria bacterium]|nr:alpha/beta hydrolase [Deltaproteobacteria bacterium]